MYARKEQNETKLTTTKAFSFLCHWYKSFSNFFCPFFLFVLLYRYLFYFSVPFFFKTFSCEFFLNKKKIIFLYHGKTSPTTAFFVRCFSLGNKIDLLKKKERILHKVLLFGKWKKELCEQVFLFECIAMFDFPLWQQMWSGFSHFRVPTNNKTTNNKKKEEEELWIMMENPVKKECHQCPSVFTSITYKYSMFEFWQLKK